MSASEIQNIVFQNQSNISIIQQDVSGKVDLSDIGAPLGVCPLDINSLVPIINLPGSGGSVDSIFGRTGHVIAVNGDYDEHSINNNFENA